MSTSQLESGAEVSEDDPEPAVTESSEAAEPGATEPEGEGRRGGPGQDEDRERAVVGGTTSGREATREDDGGDDEGRGKVSDVTGSEVGHGGARRWILRSCIALIILVAIVSSVSAGVLGWKLRNRDAVDAAARQALSTAQTYAVTLTSIDSQHIDDDYTHVLDGATGDFKTMYSQSSVQLKKMLVDNKARSVGKVVDASVRSASTDEVVVMLFVDQEITNNVSPDPRIDRSRIIMTMRSVGGRWLASKVEMA